MRNIASVLAGVIGGGILVGILGSFGHRFYGSTEVISVYDEVGMTAFIESLPTKAFIWIIVTHGLGAFLSAFLASKIATDNKLYLGFSAAAIMLVLSSINFFMVSGHPEWLLIMDPIVIIIMAFIGAKLGSVDKARS